MVCLSYVFLILSYATCLLFFIFFFFFNDTATTEIYTLSLHDALPIYLHTDQERDYFMQRYHDVISSFGGKTSYDADNRPLLVMRSNLWASGYDVDGTDQTSLGQFSGRVQQTYKHS